MIGKSTKVLLCLMLSLGTSSILANEQEEAEFERQYKADLAAYREYINYLGEIDNRFTRPIENELNLRFVGSSGSLHGKIEHLHIEFIANRRATIEEARALILLARSKYVQSINAHEKIQPYLIERPFTRVQVSITFEGINKEFADGTVSYAMNTLADTPEEKAYVVYRKNNPVTYKSELLFEETFEEAIQRRDAFPVKNPPIHETTEAIAEQENAVDELLHTYTAEMSQKYRLENWSIGGKMTNGIEEFGAHFKVVRKATLEQAREFQIAATQRLLDMVNADIKLRPYLSEYPFPASRVKMRIYFRDKNYLPYRDGTLEGVILDNNEISYYEEPPLKAWGEGGVIEEAFIIAKEPYPEALKIVENNPEPKVQPISDTVRHLRVWFHSLFIGLYEIPDVEVVVFIMSLILIGKH